MRAEKNEPVLAGSFGTLRRRSYAQNQPRYWHSAFSAASASREPGTWLGAVAGGPAACARDAAPRNAIARASTIRFIRMSEVPPGSMGATEVPLTLDASK